MSIIGGVGGGLFQLLKGIRSEAADALQNAATASSTSTSSTSTPATGTTHHGHGHHGGLFQQIASAVTGALQSAQGSSSTDPDTAITKAIAKILNQLSSASTTSASAASEDPDSDSDTDAAGQTDSDAGSALTSFLQTLQSAGVTPQQFRQDFLSAVQSLNGGQANPTSSSQLLPVGTLLNALA